MDKKKLRIMIFICFVFWSIFFVLLAINLIKYLFYENTTNLDKFDLILLLLIIVIGYSFFLLLMNYLFEAFKKREFLLKFSLERENDEYINNVKKIILLYNNSLNDKIKLIQEFIIKFNTNYSHIENNGKYLELDNLLMNNISKNIENLSNNEKQEIFINFINFYVELFNKNINYDQIKTELKSYK